MTEAPSPFFEGTKLQFAWDNTSLSMLQTCPYKYYLTIIEGWRSKSDSVHLKFGGLFADCMQYFHQCRAIGRSYEDALDYTVDLALCKTWDHEQDEGGPIEGTGQPWDSGDGKKNRETLIRSIIWYFETYREDNCETLILDNGTPAVELSFKFESGITAPFGSEYLLTGHLDRVVNLDDTPFVMDQKTTSGAIGSYYFSQYDTDNQMSQYSFAGRTVFNVPVAGVIIDAAQVMVGFTAFGRGITTRSNDQLEEWHANTAQWLRLAETFAEKGEWPQNRTACNNYGGCVFKNVCSKGPGARQFFLETDFEKRFWNPLEVR